MNKEKIQKVIKLLKTYKFDAKIFYGIEDDEDINEALVIMQEELEKPEQKPLSDDEIDKGYENIQ